MWNTYVKHEDEDLRPPSESSLSVRSSSRHRSESGDNRGTAVVELQKKEGCGLGLVVSGGLDKDDRPCVSYLRPGGIAHRSDAVEVGDYIASVNGIRTAMLKHEEIVNLLKNAGDRVLLELEYELPEPPQATFSVICKRVEVMLERDGASFGFTLRGGANADHSKSRSLVVTQIRPASCADREGTLKIGDRILAVNGIDVSQCTLSEAMNILKHADTAIRLSVEYDVSVMEAVQNASGPLLVEIDKTPGSALGIGLTTATLRGQNVICISEIKLASIADRCGALHIGDQILGIDDTGLEHVTVAEATQLLKCSVGEQIRLEILPFGPNNKTKAIIESNPCTRSVSPEYLVPPGGATSSGHHNYNSHHSTHSTQHSPHSSQHNSTHSYNDIGPPFASGYDTVRSRSNSFRTNGNIPDEGGGTLKRDRKYSNTSLSSGCTIPVAPTYISGHQVCHTETTQVTLTADHNGFGFSLQDSPFATEGLSEPPIIGNIESRGPAERCGVLQEADRVLAIDGQYLENRTLDEATQMLIDAGIKVSLHIEFDVADSVVTSCGIFMVKLAKRGGPLGITVREPKNRKPGDPMTICDVKKGSVAHRTGTIQPGDKLLSVDSLRMHQCSLDEAIEALDSAGEIVRLRIQRDDHAEYKDEEPDPNTVTYTVELEKQGGPLGVTISGTEEPFDPIIISGLSEGGLAEKTGALHIGDRILAINGESLTGLPLSEAINLLQIAGDVVTLRIARSLNHRKKAGSDGNKNGEGEEETDDFNEKYEGTPIQSVDSALESWDSSGLESSNMPHVPGKPPLPPKARALGTRGSSNNNGQNNNNNSKSNQPHLSAKTLSEHNALHAAAERWRLDDLNTPSDMTPASSADQDFWSKNLDNLDLLSQSDGAPDASDTASLSSLSHAERRTVSDGDNPRETDFDFGEDSTPNDHFSTSTKLAAEAHLREVEEEMTHIFTPTAVELHRVILFKLKETDDFGFGVSDGVYEKGVYICAIRPGGPADRSEVLRPYDRILQINNVRTKELDCSEVLPMIAQCGRQVEVVISRNPLAASERGGPEGSDVWTPRQEFKSCSQLQVKDV